MCNAIQLLIVQAMCRDYYVLGFVDRSVDTSPIAPELAAFFNDVLDSSVSKLNFKVFPLGDAICRVTLTSLVIMCSFGDVPQCCLGSTESIVSNRFNRQFL